MVVTIDGPAGSGKSTTAARVATALGAVLLNSGMLYRTVALATIEHSVDATEEALEQMLEGISMDFHCDAAGMTAALDSRDVTHAVRAPGVGSRASSIAKLPGVRAHLIPIQRDLARQYGSEPGLVAEGRDMGTVVFPDADAKFFLTASTDVRARRRLAELAAVGRHESYQAVRAAIEARDRKDSSRTIAPLRQADDAVLIDTGQLTFNEQVTRVLACVGELARRHDG